MIALAGIILSLLAIHAELSATVLIPDRANGLLCNEEAMNPYPGDCSRYVVCVRNNDGSFSGAVSECSAGEAFDKDSHACVPASQASCRNRVARQAPIPPATNTTSPDPAQKNCNDKAISCADCNSLRICSSSSNGFTFMQDVQCSDGRMNTYCDKELSTCTDKVPSGCDSGYLCTSAGYFPDATDCALYHFCYEGDGGKLIVQSQNCESGQVYSTSKKMCTNRVRPSDCHVATCPANKTLVTSFPGEPSYYVVCIAGKPYFVYYCGDYEEFNAAKGVCEVKCKQAGRIPDSKSCTGYYECTANRVGGGFTANAKVCPANTRFDVVAQGCVTGKCN